MTANKPPPPRFGRYDTYGYQSLEVGDEPIFIWGYRGYNYANTWGKKHNRRFTTRWDRKKGGIWLWRVE